MRRTSRGARFIQVWMACVIIVCALVFVAATTPAHAAQVTRGSCGASSGAAPHTSAQAPKNAASAARISLNTRSGVVGTQVVVSGAGWPSGQRVFITVENLVDEQGGMNETGRLSGATVGANGAFTMPTFRFPSLTCGVRPKAGTTASIVAATEDASVRVVTSFAVAQTPRLEVATPQQLAPLPLGTTTIAVTGTDWAPGAPVSLIAARLETITSGEWASAVTATPLPGAQAIRVTGNARGELSASVPVPPNLPPGTSVNISASAISPSYGTLVINLYPEALIPPSVAPTWDLSATRGQPGVPLTVSGDHWWPADDISIEYCRAEAAQPTALGMRCNLGPQGLVSTGYAAQLNEVVADTNGHFTASVTLPANAKPGAILVQARLPGGNARAEVYFASREFTLTPASRAQPLVMNWRDWWQQALVGILLLGVALFVFWPHISGISRSKPSSATGIRQPSHEQED
jgi:hypothetical protein